MHLSLASVTGLALAGLASAKFGLSSKGDSYSVDTNAGLVFDVDR
jgi:hypothetical protein